ncbi:MAG: creatininase family protein [Armatimonadota bacterium]|nr:creatininase family protein [Armatimonadota bacterium]
MASLLLQEWTREDARRLAAQTLAVFPVASTEQHGPHLPVSTDAMSVEHVARAAAADASAHIPVVVTPVLPFGSSQHHLPFGGTMSLSTETFYRVVGELVESLIRGGFRRIFILNGHGGNQELIHLVARDLALKHPVRIAAASYWTMAWDALVAAGAHGRGPVPGHAGTYETSQVLAMRPDLVRHPLPHRDRVEPADPRGFRPTRVESHGWWQAIDGYTDSPDRAAAEHGAAYLAAAVRAVAQALVEFHRRA